MLRFALFSGLRPWAVAGLMLGSLASAHAAGLSVGVDIGLPAVGGYYAGGPSGLFSVHRGGGGGGYRGGHHYRGGGGGWGWGWGLGLGVVIAAPWVVPVVPTTVYVEPAVLPAPPVAQTFAPTRPDPVIYPRNGQSAQQTESDRQECNRWAASQPAALADSAVFLRAVEACMDGRGYTLK